MKYEYAQIDGLVTLFESYDDMLSGIFREEVADSLDMNTIIYIRCTPDDASVFGQKFVGGSDWIYTHGLIIGDEGAGSLLRDYEKSESGGPIRPIDSIQTAISKLDKRTSDYTNDWLIIQ